MPGEERDSSRMSFMWDDSTRPGARGRKVIGSQLEKRHYLGPSRRVIKKPTNVT